MPKISVVIIAKNEERKIGRCLESIKWADEIIVVDGMSDDKTVEISEAAGAKVIRRAFSGSFADDRNAGLDVSRNDWVLTIDADDVVTEKFRLELGKAMANIAPGVVVYKFRRKNFFLGHSMDHGGFHRYIPNLVNKNFVRFKGVVHEVPAYDGAEGLIDADIEHYPFDTLTQFMTRQNRYTDIAAKYIFETHGVLPWPEVRNELVGRTFKIFWKSYVKKQGYKEGRLGLIFAVLFACINFIKWAKYWEIVHGEM